MLQNEVAYAVYSVEQKPPFTVSPTVAQEQVLALSTSGYTGSAKLVLQTSQALLCSIKATETYLQGSGQWLAVLPHQYVGGLQVLLRSIVAGTNPVFLEAGKFSAQKFVQAAAKLSHKKRYVSLVPTQLKILLDDEAACFALTQFAAVLVGAAAVTKNLLLKAQLNKINVVTTYGMSETCGGCVYSGQPLPGVEIKTDTENNIYIKGTVVTKSYLLKPNMQQVQLNNAWFCTQDVGSWDGKFLSVFGRSDDIVITGGMKVCANQVAEYVLESAKMQDCVVVGVADEFWGNVLVAFTVGRETSISTIKNSIKKNIGSYAVPKIFLDLPNIPFLKSGKADKQKLLDIVKENCA